MLHCIHEYPLGALLVKVMESEEKSSHRACFTGLGGAAYAAFEEVLGSVCGVDGCIDVEQRMGFLGEGAPCRSVGM
jgi:hypothetical protein